MWILVLVWLLMAVPISALAMDADLQARLGQMLLVGFRGQSVEQAEAVVRDIREYNLGGVILFDRDVQLGSTDRNIADPEQVRRLTAGLQALSATPLFIGVDQEGGRVRRLREERGFPVGPSAKVLGQGSPEAIRAQGRETGELLAGLGINLNFAPVADVDVNPASPAIGLLERSFSSDPELVAVHARMFAQGLQSAGVVPCLKHFPGHGSAAADSHLGVTDISRTWSPAELIPYQRLIPLQASPVIMTGHLFLDQFDPDHPATLSAPILTGLLRRKLGFDGVIVSDDMQMRAIVHHYGLDEAVILAVEAGVDILLFGNNLDYDPEIVPKVVAILARAVDEGRLAPERIETSLTRIAQLKLLLPGTGQP